MLKKTILTLEAMMSFDERLFRYLAQPREAFSASVAVSDYTSMFVQLGFIAVIIRFYGSARLWTESNDVFWLWIGYLFLWALATCQALAIIRIPVSLLFAELVRLSEIEAVSKRYLIALIKIIAYIFWMIASISVMLIATSQAIFTSS